MLRKPARSSAWAVRNRVVGLSGGFVFVEKKYFAALGILSL